jgi:antitoxin CcdA
MAKYTTVSAKIPVDLKEKLKKYGIPVGSLIREAIEREVRRKELEEVDEDMEEISQKLIKISDEEFARIIRESREKR